MKPARLSGITLSFAIALCGALAFYASFRLAFFTVAASHVIDIPEQKVRWLSWFFWASLAVPLAWLFSAVFAVIEFRKERRLRRIALSLASPVVPAVLQLVIWQLYLASVR